MKKFSILCALTLVCTALLAPQVGAANITIYDGRQAADTWYTGIGVGSEDHEVEPNCVRGDQWDLEGFSLLGRNLRIVSSYNFLSPPSGGAPGDIFISTAGPGNYNYVLDMNYSTKQFQLIQLTGTYQLSNVTESVNTISNPWAYQSGGTALGSVTSFTIDSSYTGDGTYFGVAVTGDSANVVHHVLTVVLPELGDFTGGIPDSYFHFTMNCGNDNLLGHAVPLPGAVLLLGAGLARLAAYARRRREEQV